MPGAVEKRHVLGERAGPVDESVRGDPEPSEVPERGMVGRVQLVAEEAGDRAAPELAGGEADPVDDDEVDLRPGRTAVEVG